MNNNSNFEIKSIINNVRKAALAVLQEIGPGQSEGVYEACLKQEMTMQNIAFVKTGNLPFIYKGIRLDDARYKSVLIVEGALMVQIMGVFDDGLTPDVVYGIKQDLSYCSVSHAAVINFFAANKNDIIQEVNSEA